jgi:hypothetical protein
MSGSVPGGFSDQKQSHALVVEGPASIRSRGPSVNAGTGGGDPDNKISTGRGAV